MNLVREVRIDPSANKESDNASTSKYIPNQGSNNNIQPENQKENGRNARSTVNVKNSIQTINSLANSVSTTNRTSMRLRNNNSMINRPPFR